MEPTGERPNDVAQTELDVAEDTLQWSRPKVGRVTGILWFFLAFATGLQWSRPVVGRMTSCKNNTAAFLVSQLQWSRPVIGRMTCSVRNRDPVHRPAAMEPADGRPEDAGGLSPKAQAIYKLQWSRPVTGRMTSRRGFRLTTWSRRDGAGRDRPDDHERTHEARRGDDAAMEPAVDRPDDSSP